MVQGNAGEPQLITTLVEQGILYDARIPKANLSVNGVMSAVHLAV